MKIRWTSRSLRLRITPEELDLLKGGVPVTEEIELPGGTWSATIYPTDHGTGISLRRAGALGFLLSAADRDRLAAPDTEGIYFSTAGDSPVRYFIEKDFPCAHPQPPARQERATSTFSPPAGYKSSCAEHE